MHSIALRHLDVRPLIWLSVIFRENFREDKLTVVCCDLS